MAIVKSVELTNDESIPRVRNIPRDSEASSRIVTFTFFPSGEAAGSTIRLGVLKKGWRLRGGRLNSPIIGAAGTTVSVGIAGNVAKYITAILLDAVAEKQFNGSPDSPPLFLPGEVITVDTELIATTAVGALLTSTVNALRIQVRYTWN